MKQDTNKTRTLILGPGLLCDADIWKHAQERLADLADIHVANTLQDDNIADMARRLLTTAPPTFAYAGFSMGGYLGFELLRQAPERISKLALLSTTAQPDPVEHTQLREMFIEMTKQDCFEEAVARNLSLFLTPEYDNDDQRRNYLTAMAKRTGPEVYVRQLTAIINRVDSRATLSDIRVPTCIVCGRDDQLTPIAKHLEIAEQIPSAQLHILNYARHFITIEQPQAVTALLHNWVMN